MEKINNIDNTIKFLSEGICRINGKDIPYNAISEENIIYDNGNKEASIFSYSYIRSDVADKSKRPVIFAYNGGPGSSCIWLHLGFMGPTKVKLDDPVNPPTVPPFVMENNQHCLLDICDIVMIDPVGTGYARLYNKNAEGKFYSIDQDAQAIASFIEGWLLKYDRWNSPKYLLGESYGTLRNGVLAEVLMGGPTIADGRLRAISINGIIMLGTALQNGMNSETVESSVINFSSMAAVNWYHNTSKNQSIEAFVKEAYEFSYNEYLRAIFMGSNLSSDKQEKIANKISYYIGIPEEYLKDNGLKISMNTFIGMCCKSKKMQVGLYDGRYLLPMNNNMGLSDPVADDGAMGQYTPVYTAAMSYIKKKELNIDFDREYNAIVFRDVNGKWNYNSTRTSMECLSGCMRRNPKMKIFFGTGYYDLCTVAGYVRYIVSHNNLPKDRVVIKEYESGHMPYMGEESSSLLEYDLRQFIEESM